MKTKQTVHSLESSAKFEPKNPRFILRHRLQEGAFILFSALAIFFWVALLTYYGSDPGWSRTAASKTIQNAAGQAGAWFADFCLYLFGYIAYMVPALIGYAGICIIQNRLGTRVFYGWLWGARVLGFAAALVSGCGLATLYFSVFNQGMPAGAGGISGQFIKTELVPACGYLGSTLLLLAVFLVGVTLATGLSWFGLLDVTGKSLQGKLTHWNLKKPIGRWKINIRFPNYFAALRQWYRDRKNKSVAPKLQRITPTLFEEEGIKSSTMRKVAVKTAVIERPVSVERPMSVRLPQNRPEPPVESKSHLKSESLAASSASWTSHVNLPSADILEQAEEYSEAAHFSTGKLDLLSREVEARLLEFGVQAAVAGVYPGPVITRFELELAPGVKVSKITGLAKDLARALSVTRVRVVEIIPGKSVVGLEIPNEHRELVRLREILESTEYQESTSPLSLALGKDISGRPAVVNLAKMPHLLVAGTTGSGKSVGINVMLLSLLYKATPLEVRLILIDPKMLELSIYEGIPHLLTPVVTDMKDAANALRWCVGEMERRYQLMAALGVRNVVGYNRKIFEAQQENEPILDPLWRPERGGERQILDRLPYIVVIIDEFADMMMVVGKKVEELIARIAQKARAAGIHLILATQRPSVDVITGLIKANVPTRIAYQVSSRIDSRTILDQQGAEQLLGHGDMLYLAPGTGVPERIHGAFVSDEEVHAVVKALKQLGEPDYAIDVLGVGVSGLSSFGFDDEQNGEQDDLYDSAVQIVAESRKASISHLQRRLKIGYNRAARLIETMEAAGVVSNMQHNGVREVLVGQ